MERKINRWYTFSSVKHLSFDLHIPAIVEQVKDGTTLRVRLLMPEGDHQMVNIALAGVRSARASTKQGEPAEPWGEEVGTTTPSFICDIFLCLGQIFYRISPAATFGTSTNTFST
jgi:staphylococcal nuclease domain-containing protein 1